MRPATIVFLLAAAAGLYFAGSSTADFVAHLDRQAHAIHCSFIPGAAADMSGTSGCSVALMSPYSSVFRTAIWGGIPATLAGMAVFAFLLWRGIALVTEGKQEDPSATRFLFLSTLLPVITSLGYGWLAFTELDAFCKLCVGIYLSSFTACGAAAVLMQQARGEATDFGGVFGRGFAQGVGFVALPVALYAAMVPDFSDRLGSCGTLEKPADPNKVLVPLGAQNGRDAIEVLDPLCPSCKGFEERLSASGLGEQLSRKALLFPLDSECNWMLKAPMHPGACAVSEGVLCAGDEAEAVLHWAFEHQEEIRTAAGTDPGAAAKMVKEAFPKVASCVGTPKVKQRLTQSLRWAVANQLPVMTPQVYVDGTKLCDEDSDLGMDWALARLLSTSRSAE